MNKQEIGKAIEYLKEPIGKPLEDHCKAIKLAISALEKQIPKKPIENFYDEQDDGYWYDEGYTYQCPLCEESGVGRYSKEICEWVYQMTHCEKCGQAIDWRNNDEKVIYIPTHEW